MCYKIKSCVDKLRVGRRIPTQHFSTVTNWETCSVSTQLIQTEKKWKTALCWLYIWYCAWQPPEEDSLPRKTFSRNIEDFISHLLCLFFYVIAREREREREREICLCVCVCVRERERERERESVCQWASFGWVSVFQPVSIIGYRSFSFDIPASFRRVSIYLSRFWLGFDISACFDIT